MNRPFASLALALLLALTACSSDTAGRTSNADSDPDPDPATVPSTTDATPSSDPQPTGTSAPAPDTSDPSTPTSTPSSTTTTTTEASPTTTLDPIADIEAAVKQARLDGQAVFAAGEADPTDATIRIELAKYQTGDRLAAAIEDLDGLASDGLAVRPADPDLSRIVFPKQIVLPDGAESSEAFLEECRVNSDVLFTVASADSGVEAIVDDGLFSYVSELRYVLEDGRWKHESGVRIERIVGRDAC